MMPHISLNYLIRSGLSLNAEDIAFGVRSGMLDTEDATSFARTISKLSVSEERDPERRFSPQRKWLYLHLGLVFDLRHIVKDPFAMVEQIYADFDYPPEIARFVRYMPISPGEAVGEAVMYANWAEYLSSERDFFGLVPDAMTAGTYDEAEIVTRLSRLNHRARAAFATACAQALLPVYEQLASPSDAATLIGIVDAVWGATAIGMSSADLRQLQAEAESFVPSDDEVPWTSDIALAQNVAAAVAYAVRTCANGDVREAGWAARQVHELAEYIAARRSAVGSAGGSTDESAAVQEVLKFVERWLVVVEMPKPNWAALRAAARTAGVRLSAWTHTDHARRLNRVQDEPVAGDRLPQLILDLIAETTAELGDVSERILEQARVARIVRFSATSIDVELPDGTPPIAIGNGPITSWGITDERGDVVGTVMVWMASGLFIGMEQDWYVEETPTRWPRVEQIRDRSEREL